MPGVEEGLKIRKDVLKNAEVKAAFEAMIAQKTPEAQVAELEKIAKEAMEGASSKEGVSTFIGLFVRMVNIIIEMKDSSLLALITKNDLIHKNYYALHKKVE